VSRYFHPEFGYFCPTPRLRRELRVACRAGLLGVALGTIGVIALNRIERAVNLASLVPAAATQPGAEGVVPRRLANAKGNDLQKPAKGDAAQGAAYESTRQSTAQSPKRGQEAAAPSSREFGSAGATKARLHAKQRDNGPELARIALGRPAALENATPPSPQRDTPRAAGQIPAASSAGAIAASAAPRTQGAPPEPPRAAAPALDAKPQRSLPSPGRIQKQHSEPVRESSGNGNGLENAERAYARDTASPRTVFWDWSR
jgi:hypothetical protein